MTKAAEAIEDNRHDVAGGGHGNVHYRPSTSSAPAARSSAPVASDAPVALTKKLRDAAQTCSDVEYRELLKGAADTVQAALGSLDGALETLRDLNCAWAHATRVLNNIPAPAAPISPQTGPTQPAVLAAYQPGDTVSTGSREPARRRWRQLGHGSQRTQLRAYVERVERLEEEKEDLRR
jgi:hypothetical protein